MVHGALPELQHVGGDLRGAQDDKASFLCCPDLSGLRFKLFGVVRVFRALGSGFLSGFVA